MDVEHRDTDRESRDVPAVRPLGATVRDQTDVGRGPSHVERDRALDPAERGDALGRDHPAAGPDTRASAGWAAASSIVATPPDERITRGAGRPLFSGPSERPQVAAGHRPEVGVDRGRRCSLVLAELGRDLVRRDDVRLRMTPSELGGYGSLVRRVAEGEEQAYGDRLGVEVGHGREVERRDQAVRPDPFLDADAVLERDERLGMVEVEPVEVRAVLSAQMQKVLEADRRHERRPRPFSLQQGVRRDRRAVAEALERR